MQVSCHCQLALLANAATSQLEPSEFVVTSRYRVQVMEIAAEHVPWARTFLP